MTLFHYVRRQFAGAGSLSLSTASASPRPRRDLRSAFHWHIGPQEGWKGYCKVPGLGPGGRGWVRTVFWSMLKHKETVTQVNDNDYALFM